MQKIARNFNSSNVKVLVLLVLVLATAANAEAGVWVNENFNGGFFDWVDQYFARLFEFSNSIFGSGSLDIPGGGPVTSNGSLDIPGGYR